MSTYETILRNVLGNMNHMPTYELILRIINSYVNIWTHIGNMNHMLTSGIKLRNMLTYGLYCAV